MKKLIYSTLLLFMVSVVACKKADKIKIVPPNAADTLGYFRYQEQPFVSSAHTTTGTIILFGNKASNPDTLMYYFKNFKTDDGPNLDIYISEELVPVNFTNIGDLKTVEGTFFYKAKTTPSLNASSFVIVWCSEFSVNFGYATLVH